MKKYTLKMNLIQALFKPALENKLKLKKAVVVNFRANKLKDTLEISGFGMLKDSIMYGNMQCDPLKMSDYQNYEAMLLSNINRNVDNCKQWHVCYLTINYEDKTIKTEIWYETTNNGKSHITFENKF